MLTYSAPSAASPDQAWELIARPQNWSRWAPHVRGAWGLGAPEVRPGALGAVRLLGVVPVPAEIVDVRPGRSWRWRVGVVLMEHRVDPRRGGCTVTVDLVAPRPVEALLRASYGPVVSLLVRNLARAAEDWVAG